MPTLCSHVARDVAAQRAPADSGRLALESCPHDARPRGVENTAATSTRTRREPTGKPGGVRSGRDRCLLPPPPPQVATDPRGPPSSEQRAPRAALPTRSSPAPPPSEPRLSRYAHDPGGSKSWTLFKPPRVSPSLLSRPLREAAWRPKEGRGHPLGPERELHERRARELRAVVRRHQDVRGPRRRVASVQCPPPPAHQEQQRPRSSTDPASVTHRRKAPFSRQNASCALRRLRPQGQNLEQQDSSDAEPHELEPSGQGCGLPPPRGRRGPQERLPVPSPPRTSCRRTRGP